MGKKNPIQSLVDAARDGFEDTVNFVKDPVQTVKRAGQDIGTTWNSVTGKTATRNENAANDAATQKLETAIKDKQTLEDETLTRDRKRALMKSPTSGRGGTLLTSPLGIVDDQQGASKTLLGL